MHADSGVWTVVPCLLLLAGLAPSRAAEAESLERGFVQQAPALIKHFKTNGQKNVGVLKFLVIRQGAEKFSDNVGTLNILLARRLEVALVLANDIKAPVGIIRNASAVAARTDGANHLTAAGRDKLFAARYPLAWGNPPEEVAADAFVTGTAQISKDLRTLKVSLFVLDRKDNTLTPFGKDFTVHIDAGKLAEMNESFVLRGVPDDGKAIESAAEVAHKEAKHPLAGGALPVSLTVLYDDRVVTIEHRDGKAFVPEPKEGQKVAFLLRRDATKVRYGAVLKVNGENTVGRERLPDVHCRKWILAAGSGPILITGYQIDAKTEVRFRVLSRAESKAREINYGADVGTITLTVFRELQKEVVADPTEDREKRNARLSARAELPARDRYNELKAALLSDANKVETRGLIGEGEKKESKVREVSFKPEPVPVMSVTVIYYRR